MIERARRPMPAMWLAVLVLGIAGCGGAESGESGESEAIADASLAARLSLLPDQPELRRHVLIADLERFRRDYPEEADLRAAFVGVWLPDALVGADRALWRRAFVLGLEDISAFVKGSDLGFDRERNEVVLDFNFAYNPSCAYDPRWACPLAPPANVLSLRIAAGEQHRPALISELS